MRKIALLFILGFCFNQAYCQATNDLIIEHIERMSEDSNEEYSDYIAYRKKNSNYISNDNVN